MLQTVLTRQAFSELFRKRAAERGEEVWDRAAVIGHRAFFDPLMWTTLLANDFVRLSPKPEEPDGWVMREVSSDEFRLYLRVGEAYTEGGSHHFRPPVRLEVKSPDEFIRLRVLQRSQWWEAAFVCPFCEQVCTGESKCQHQVVSHGQAVQRLYGTPFDALYREMSQGRFSCNLANARIPGLAVKIPRRFLPLDWFRSACAYAERPEVVQEAVEVLSKAKALA